jgi:hypothetical protein
MFCGESPTADDYIGGGGGGAVAPGPPAAGPFSYTYAPV